MSLPERTRPGLGIIEPCLPSPFRQVFSSLGTLTLSLRTHPRGHIKPCLPLPAERPPSGPDWLHEIKHDGFRIIARRDANGVRLYTRNGYNFACIVLTSRYQHGDPPHSLWLLRACRKRPACSSATNQRNELAPLHSIT